MRSKLRIASVCLAVAVGLFMSGRVASAAPRQDDTRTGRDSMMAQMGALDARITTLTQQMNATAGEAKVTAMAALLNAILEQHKTMRSEMMMEAGSGTAAPEASKPMCTMEKPAPSTATAPSHNHSGN